ncbi:MAG: glycosyltransferase [Candidatus Riflebacteria bacterium]|nr:glycosyltransferase [Candidatus Riflebacteria bacterium]
MKKSRVLIFIVCYQAEQFIESVLERIPSTVLSNPVYETEILIIDDQSSDQTFQKACKFVRTMEKSEITVLYNPRNQGYGGNQKIGYYYAIEKGFDHVVMLHGDGQYPPEYLDQILQPLLNNTADVVLGSRLLKKKDALAGGMPLYKWLGNQILTFAQNIMLKSNLSEFHTGYRAYRINSLKSVPFHCNSDYFDFDTDILIQMVDTGARIAEIPIPTHYGEEVCRVDGLKYAQRIIRSTFLSRMMKWGLFYHPRFDYEGQNHQYQLKLGYESSHQFALERIRNSMRVINLSGNLDFFSEFLEKQGFRIFSPKNGLPTAIENFDFKDALSETDTILLLDILEHLKSPEKFLEKIRNRFCREAPLTIVTTGNVAFIFVRIALLFGQFNYGKHGILDLTHTRLFTFRSLLRILRDSGFEIVEIKGIPAPFPLALGNGFIANFLLKLNNFFIQLSPGLFSFQIGVTAKPLPNLEYFLEHALITSKILQANNSNEKQI